MTAGRGQGPATGKLWFDFLNLGYKLSPSSGTDFPWGDVPGAVRSYVRINGPFTPQAWFDGLKAGRTFVTDGPILQFSLNGQGMGSELRVQSGDPLTIEARARMNPEIDRLDRVELIEQGGVIRTVTAKAGSTEVNLQVTLPASHGSWFVVRAFGKQQQEDGRSIVAMTAPIYVDVDGGGFWKPQAVPGIAARLKKSMQSILTARREPYEGWDTWKPDAQYWDAQRPLLEQRIEQASAIYDELVRRARRE